MNTSDASIELQRKALWKKLDDFRISFNKKCEINKISIENGDREAIDYSYNEVLDSWESMENTLKEISKFQKEHQLS